MAAAKKRSKMQPPFFIHAFLSTILIFLLSANVDAQYPGRKHYAGYYDYSRDLVYRTGKAEWSECHRPCNMPRGVKFRKNLCLLCSRDGRKCVKVADHKCGEENLGINLLSCYDGEMCKGHGVYTGNWGPWERAGPCRSDTDKCGAKGKQLFHRRCLPGAKSREARFRCGFVRNQRHLKHETCNKTCGYEGPMPFGQRHYQGYHRGYHSYVRGSQLPYSSSYRRRRSFPTQSNFGFNSQIYSNTTTLPHHGYGRRNSYPRSESYTSQVRHHLHPYLPSRHSEDQRSSYANYRRRETPSQDVNLWSDEHDKLGPIADKVPAVDFNPIPSEVEKMLVQEQETPRRRRGESERYISRYRPYRLNRYDRYEPYNSVRYGRNSVDEERNTPLRPREEFERYRPRYRPYRLSSHDRFRLDEERNAPLTPWEEFERYSSRFSPYRPSRYGRYERPLQRPWVRSERSLLPERYGHQQFNQYSPYRGGENRDRLLGRRDEGYTDKGRYPPANRRDEGYTDNGRYPSANRRDEGYTDKGRYPPANRGQYRAKPSGSSDENSEEASTDDENLPESRDDRRPVQENDRRGQNKKSKIYEVDAERTDKNEENNETPNRKAPKKRRRKRKKKRTKKRRKKRTRRRKKASKRE